MSNHLRAPAVPLIPENPDMLLWSFADKLTDDTVRHRSGTRNNILGLIEVDDKMYRFMMILLNSN